MSRLRFTKIAIPSAPGANQAEIFMDTADRRLKQIDDNGLISIMNNDGLQDFNFLSNGSLSIQQRVLPASTAIAGVSTTTRAGQVADRWAVTASVTTNLNWAQIDAIGTPETGLSARYYGSIIASTAGKKVMLSQFLTSSDIAHLRGGKVRVSLKHNQKVGSGQLFHIGLLQLTAAGTADTCPAFLSGAWSVNTGTDPAWGTNLSAIAPDSSPTPENGTVSGSYCHVTTVATTWTRSSAVFSVPSDCKNLCVVFFADATGGNTDNVSVAELQLTKGPDLVDFIELPKWFELVHCQRYYAKSFPYGIAPAASVTVANGGFGSDGILGKAGSGTALGSIIPVVLPVRMWKVPTVTLFTPVGAGAVVYRHTGTTPLIQGTTAILANSTTDIGFIVTATNEATTNGAVGDLVSIHWTADAEFVA